ncbi:MAG: hypothetical protein NTZ51_11885, partial [Proteobacteria bacterium]|nr:hypothetical protein [Pseudomonadota bacterium]
MKTFHTASVTQIFPVHLLSYKKAPVVFLLSTILGFGVLRASALSDQAGLPRQSGGLMIRGKVICEQCTGGPIYLGAWQGKDPFNSPILSAIVLQAPGSFMLPLKDIPDGSPVWVYGFWDKDNANGGSTAKPRPSSGDLFGSYASNPLIVASDMGEIEITLDREITFPIILNITCTDFDGGKILAGAQDGPDAMGDAPGTFKLFLKGVPVGTPVWLFAYWDRDGSGFQKPTTGDRAGKYEDNPYIFQQASQPVAIDINIPVSSGNIPPNTPGNPSPPDGSVNQPPTIILSWEGSDPNPGDTVSYAVFFGTDASTSQKPIIQTEKTFAPGTLEPATTYFWKVIAIDSKGAKTAGPLWSFKTAGTGPTVVSVNVDPPIIFNESKTPLLVTAQVTHPLGLAAIASVYIEPKRTGETTNPPLFDDGTHGDQTAGDGTYSRSGIVDASKAVGTKNVVVVAVDKDGKKDVGFCKLEVRNKADDSVTSASQKMHSFDNEIKDQTILVTYYLQTSPPSLSVFADCSVGLSLTDPLGQVQELPAFSSMAGTFEIIQALSGTWNYTVNSNCPGTQNYSISTCSEGTGLVSGIVSDSRNGQGITNVLITSNSGGSAVTEEGYYVMVTPAGKISLQASASSYNTSSNSLVTVSAGDSAAANFSL